MQLQAFEYGGLPVGHRRAHMAGTTMQGRARLCRALFAGAAGASEASIVYSRAGKREDARSARLAPLESGLDRLASQALPVRCPKEIFASRKAISPYPRWCQPFVEEGGFTERLYRVRRERGDHAD